MDANSSLPSDSPSESSSASEPDEVEAKEFQNVREASLEETLPSEFETKDGTEEEHKSASSRNLLETSSFDEVRLKEPDLKTTGELLASESSVEREEDVQELHKEEKESCGECQ